MHWQNRRHRNIALEPDIDGQMTASGHGGGQAHDTRRSRFDACFEAHYSDVLAYAIRRVEDRATAEDVLAETFAVAWRRREAIPEAPLPWLYGIAARIIANQQRSARRRLRLRLRLSSEPARRSGRDPADVVGERDAIVAALSGLSEAQREVLRLAAWEDLDVPDAAAVLGCTPAAFRVRLHRARRELAKHLDPSGHSADESATEPLPCQAAEEAE